MKSALALISFALFITITSCNNMNQHSKTTKVQSNFEISGTIQEVIQTSEYTYCKMKVASDEYWIAITKMPVKKSETLYFNQGLEMKDFHSTELDRTFPSVFFVQEVSTDPNSTKFKAKPNQLQPQKPEIVKNEVVIDKANGGIRIAELYANKSSYNGKKVKISGKITKYNPGIMGKNWVHLQDGTDNNGNFDLTVTTQAEVSLGAVVTFEGTIALNKDFGAGYSYSVIMEEASLIE